MNYLGHFHFINYQYVTFLSCHLAILFSVFPQLLFVLFFQFSNFLLIIENNLCFHFISISGLFHVSFLSGGSSLLYAFLSYIVYFQILFAYYLHILHEKTYAYSILQFSSSVLTFYTFDLHLCQKIKNILLYLLSNMINRKDKFTFIFTIIFTILYMISVVPTPILFNFFSAWRNIINISYCKGLLETNLLASMCLKKFILLLILIVY